MGITATHTYVTLDVSPLTYREISQKLREAGYDHCFMDDGEIDLHGLALAKPEGEAMRCTQCGWPVDTTAKPEFTP